jgi:hypothetical protein
MHSASISEMALRIASGVGMKRRTSVQFSAKRDDSNNDDTSDDDHEWKPEYTTIAPAKAAYVSTHTHTHTHTRKHFYRSSRLRSRKSAGKRRKSVVKRHKMNTNSSSNSSSQSDTEDDEVIPKPPPSKRARNVRVSVVKRDKVTTKRRSSTSSNTSPNLPPDVWVNIFTHMSPSVTVLSDIIKYIHPLLIPSNHNHP